MARDGGAPTATASTVEDRPEEPAVAPADRPVDAEVMQNRLREKEQLVAALTERLEQAAEQLDRLRRTGVDKGRRPLGGGFPAELLEDHKNTVDDLKRVIARWEDMQAEATLGRIETQIVELRDLLTGSAHVGAHPVSHSSGHAASAAAAPPARERPAEVAATRPAGKAGGNAWWEAQKAALLGDSPPAEEQASAERPGEPEPPPPGDQQSPAAGPIDLGALALPDLPATIDFENVTLEEAREAIRQRDQIIQQLREPLILLRASGQLPADLQSLAGIPEALKLRIAEIETQWQAKFRQVELDLSLERARLAREQSAVRQQQDALQKQIKRSSGQAKPPADDGAKGDDSTSKRRWFRFMGKTEDGADSGEEDKG